MTQSNDAVQHLNLPDAVIDLVSEDWGIKKLYPPQAEAMPAALSGRNLLLAIPTACGKSLIAYLAIARKLLVDEVGSRAIYIVPLKALAREKLGELKQLAKAVGLQVGMAVGDASREVQNLDAADIIVCTSEKLDSLCRTRPQLVQGTSIIIADEVHLVNDSSRGPTMEVNLARLMLQYPAAQVIALSATISNPKKLAEWLKAELILSEWRPVPLEYATLAERWLEVRKRISADSNETLPVPRKLEGPKTHIAWCALLDTIQQQGQLLVFVSTRRSAESEARKLAERSVRLLTEEPEKLRKLRSLANELQKETDSATGDRLAAAVRGGVAFHHAGLTQKQRKSIEDSFRSGLLFCITATPTLASGVNLPARRVLIRDLKRWQDGLSGWISTIEVRQMMGRAGRPRYDNKGEAWLACKGEDPLLEADAVAERYIHGEPEPVVSKLAAEPALRMHLLSGIATGGLCDRQSVRRFFNATFLSCSQAEHLIDERVDKTISWLVEMGFISRMGIDESIALQELPPQEEEMWQDELPCWADSASNTPGVELAADEPTTLSESRVITSSIGFERADSLKTEVVIRTESREMPRMRYEATTFGKRVARLYLDPMSATIIRNGLMKALNHLVEGREVGAFGLMHLLAATPDFLVIWPKRSSDDLHVKAAMEEEGLFREEPLEDMLLALTQSAWTLERWIEEDSARKMEEEMKIAPGDLRTRIDLMAWLLHSAKEIILNDETIDSSQMPFVARLSAILDNLNQRIRHGCKEELLPMVRIPNIGRSRARDLLDLGLTEPKDLLRLSAFDQSRILALKGWGPKILQRAIADLRRLR